MPWFVLLIILAATTAASYLLNRGRKTERQKPGEVNFPTATENRPIDVIFGKVRQTSPNYIWWGDLKTEPVYQKVPNPLTFGLTKKKVETGQFRYNIGADIALCLGENTRLREIQVDDKAVWTGDLTSGTISFNQSNLFGGDKKEGGVAGTFDYYGGSWAQTYNTYVQSQNSGEIVPSYRGLAHLVQRGPSTGFAAPRILNGYVGLSANPRPWSFIVQRCPSNLGLPAFREINDGDGNPVEILYELLTNQDYGLKKDASEIDLPAFAAAAATLYSEGTGMSLIWNTQEPIEELVKDIKEIIDASVYEEPTTGKWTIHLIRADYEAADLEVLDASLIIEHDINLKTLNESANHVIIGYTDKTQNYKIRNSEFKETANRQLQGLAIQAKSEPRGLSNGVQAAKQAYREARIISSNLRIGNIKLKPAAHFLRPGVPVLCRFRDETGRLLEIVMRPGDINFGELLNGVIETSLVEDVFGLGNPIYSPPAPSGWTPISGAAADISRVFVTEQPYLLSGAGARVWAFAGQPDNAQQTFDTLVSADAGVSYPTTDEIDSFAPTATVAVAVSKTANPSTGSITLNRESNTYRLEGGSATEIEHGKNWFVFADTGELGAFETITDNGDGTITLGNVWRGLLDTAPASHAVGGRVFFFGAGESATPDVNYDSGANLKVKLVGNSLSGRSSETAAAAANLTIGNRFARPLVPGNPNLGGTYYGAALPAAGSSDITINWQRRNRLTLDKAAKQTSGDMAPETFQTTVIKVFHGLTLLNTYSALGGTSWVYTSAMQTIDGAAAFTDLTFVIYSERGGVSSWNAHLIAAARPTGTPSLNLPIYTLSGSYTAPIAGDSTSIGGIPITGQPDATNTQLLYNPVTGSFTWSPPATGGTLTVREVDGSPTGAASILEFPNGQLTLVSPGVYRVTPLAGATGASGPAGSPGATGATGATGAAGSPGSVQYFGTGVPLVSLGVDNDYYLRTSNADYYQKSSGSWLIITNLRGANGQALPRQTITITLNNLLDGETRVGTVNIGKGASLLLVEASHLSRLRMYLTAAKRAIDLNRPATVPPLINTPHGVFLDLNMDTSAYLTFPLSPQPRASNMESTPTIAIPYAIANLSGGDVASYTCKITYTLEEE